MTKAFTNQQLMRRREVNRAYQEHLNEVGEKASMDQACIFAAKWAGSPKAEREVIMILENRLPFGF